LEPTAGDEKMKRVGALALLCAAPLNLPVARGDVFVFWRRPDAFMKQKAAAKSAASLSAHCGPRFNTESQRASHS
jgi:hypothetical protein